MTDPERRVLHLALAFLTISFLTLWVCFMTGCAGTEPYVAEARIGDFQRLDRGDAEEVFTFHNPSPERRQLTVLCLGPEVPLGVPRHLTVVVPARGEIRALYQVSARYQGRSECRVVRSRIVDKSVPTGIDE